MLTANHQQCITHTQRALSSVGRARHASRPPRLPSGMSGAALAMRAG
ncbi:hypothetical protein L6258_01765 [Candidatus Parcubacteria bacterium]|nr:hypothetical protein [Candidatus Parcubacteria bacterium]